MKRIGLVLGGGGVRGAYQIGAVTALYELGFKCDIVTGASVGALNALLVAENKLDKLKNIWKNISFETIIKHEYKMKNKSLETLLIAPLKNGFSLEPLETIIEENVDEESLRNSDIKMGIVVTEKGMKYRSYTLDEIPENELSNYILTSCSAWPFLKKRSINGKVCYDAYYSDNLPIKLAFEMGAEKVIAIDVMKGFKKKVEGDNILYLKPKKNKYFFLNFGKEVIDEIINLGYKETMDRKDEIIKFLSEE